MTILGAVADCASALLGLSRISDIRANKDRVSDFHDLTKIRSEPQIEIALEKHEIPVSPLGEKLKIRIQKGDQ